MKKRGILWSAARAASDWIFYPSLLTETYRPEEKAKAQGAKNLLIFAMMAVSSFSSGLIVTGAGWEAMNLSALPMVAVVIVAITWLALRVRRAAVA